MDKPTAAILLTLGVHILGIGALFWLALDGRSFDWRGWWPRDDEGPGEPPAPVPPAPAGDGLPLPDAEQAMLRLRDEHDRLHAGRRRVRRPVREPDEPGRAPSRRP